MLNGKVLDVVLEELNLKEDEEFKVRSLIIVIDGTLQHRINKLECFYNGVWNHSIHLGDLLLGKLKVIKLPFVPKLNHFYYCPNILTPSLYHNAVNYNGEYDKHRIKHELCFRTKEETIAKAKWLLNQNH